MLREYACYVMHVLFHNKINNKINVLHASNLPIKIMEMFSKSRSNNCLSPANDDQMSLVPMLS